MRKNSLVVVLMISGLFLSSVSQLLAESPSYNVALGSKFVVKTSDLPTIDAFMKKPKVYLKIDGKKKKTAKVLEFTSDTATCAWTKKLTAGTYPLYVFTKSEREVKLTDTFTIEEAVITSVSPSSGAALDEITLSGNFFGSKKPKLKFIYTLNEKTVKKNCKIKKPLAYADVKGKDGKSCMDVETGESKIVFYVPKKVDESIEGTLFLKNKITEVSIAFNSGGGGGGDGDYLIVDLSSGGVSETSSAPSDLLTNDEYKTTKMVFRKINAGIFSMGSPEDELGRYSSDARETQHEVTLTEDFHIGVFEVTQRQYELITGEIPSSYTGNTRPVTNVSWNEVRGGNWPSGDPSSMSFMSLLRSKTSEKYKFDLPTDAQWEYACRAGTTTALNSGKNLTGIEECPNLAKVGWYSGNSWDDRHREVGTVKGTYAANKWGLYDMHGNVNEMCLDWFQNDPGSEAVKDPVGPSSGYYRCSRGGSWFNTARWCRSGYRGFDIPANSGSSLGFRVAITADN